MLAHVRRTFLRAVLVGCAAIPFGSSVAGDAPPSPSGKRPAAGEAAPLPYFARVGNDTISIEDYARTLQEAMKQKYFHGKIPEKELLEFRRQIGDQMINDLLYLQEAKRRGIAPDKEEVATKVKELERKKKSDSYWQEHKDQMLKVARREFEITSVVRQLEQSVRAGAVPSAPQIQDYYASNAAKFTAPERVKVHMLLLKVDPSSTSQEWDAAASLASSLVTKLKAGESFEELARIHSGDESAAAGGDMGYIHKGMLGSEAAAVLEKMKVGDLSEPVFLLEGVAVFRLDDREIPRLNEFQRVDDTAKDLLQKEMAEKAWKNLAESLRKKTKIEINEALLSAG
jgi:parvulin-like peptidyl-prolyl isomerase